MKKESNMLLANISHDLKTPITSIKGYVEGIQDGIADTPEKMKRYLDTIHAKAEVIDDLSCLALIPRPAVSLIERNDTPSTFPSVEIPTVNLISPP